MQKSHYCSSKRNKKAQSLLEFALVFPLFIALVLFVIDILRFYFIQQTLSFQVREGLRAGAVYDPQATNTTTRRQVIIDAVNESNLYKFDIVFQTDPAIDTSTAQVVGSLNPSEAGIADTLVTLTLSYQSFTFLTPFIGVLFESQPTGSIPLSVSQSFQNESL